jgi:hypothetical protein
MRKPRRCTAGGTHVSEDAPCQIYTTRRYVRRGSSFEAETKKGKRERVCGEQGLLWIRREPPPFVATRACITFRRRTSALARRDQERRGKKRECFVMLGRLLREAKRKRELVHTGEDKGVIPVLLPSRAHGGLAPPVRRRTRMLGACFGLSFRLRGGYMLPSQTRTPNGQNTKRSPGKPGRKATRQKSCLRAGHSFCVRRQPADGKVDPRLAI